MAMLLIAQSARCMLISAVNLGRFYRSDTLACQAEKRQEYAAGCKQNMRADHEFDNERNLSLLSLDYDEIFCGVY